MTVSFDVPDEVVAAVKQYIALERNKGRWETPREFLLFHLRSILAGVVATPGCEPAAIKAKLDQIQALRGEIAAQAVPVVDAVVETPAAGETTA